MRLTTTDHAIHWSIFKRAHGPEFHLNPRAATLWVTRSFPQGRICAKQQEGVHTQVLPSRKKKSTPLTFAAPSNVSPAQCTAPAQRDTRGCTNGARACVVSKWTARSAQRRSLPLPSVVLCCPFLYERSARVTSTATNRFLWERFVSQSPTCLAKSGADGVRVERSDDAAVLPTLLC